MERRDYLDGWRGLALVLLLTGHFFPNRWINLGRLGVEFFFALSGLLIGEILFVKRPPLPVFYWRRISRIFPAYYLLVFTMFAAALLRGTRMNGRGVLSVLFFYANYQLPALDGFHVPIDHVWSVCVEEHLYCLLAIVALCSRRLNVKEGWLLALLVGVLIPWMVTRSLDDPGDYYQVFWRTDCRALGIVFSALLVCVRRDGVPFRVSGWLVPVAIAVGMLVQIEGVPDVVKYTLGAALLALAVNSLDRAPAWLRRCLELRPLRMLGLWSFSIYLWQQPFFFLKDRIPPVIGLAASIAVGSLVYHLFESPVRTWLNARVAQPNGRAISSQVRPIGF